MVQLRRKEKKIRIKTCFQKELLNLKKKEILLRNKTRLKKINFQKYGYLFLSPFLCGLKARAFSTGLELKTLSYRFLKDAKVLKSGCSQKQSFGLLQQTNKFFQSNVEKKKKGKLTSLRKKALIFLKKKVFSFSQSQLSLRKRKQLKNFWFLKRKQNEFLIVLRRRSLRFKFKKPLGYSRRVLERRFLVHRFKITRRKKQKYKKLFRFLLRNLRKQHIKSLLQYYIFGSKKHKDSLKYKKRKRLLRRRRKYKTRLLKVRGLKRKKIRRRLVKKWNLKKRWKRRGIFRFFRSKLRFLNYFSVPRHFEINYKTGEILYLGFSDSSSLDLRLPFRLNIRRLTTHFSS